MFLPRLWKFLSPFQTKPRHVNQISFFCITSNNINTIVLWIIAGVFSSLVTRKSSKHTSKKKLSKDLLDLSRLSKIVALQKCFCFFSEFIPYCGFAAILQRLLEFRWVQGRPRPLRMSGPCGTPSSPCRYGHKYKLSTPPFLDLASKICL